MDKIVTLKEIYDEAVACKEEIYNLAEGAGHSVWITYHFSVSRYDQVWSDYHLNITDEDIHMMGDFDELKYHTYKRNTGNIGIALDCCLDCSLNGSSNNPILDLGTYPPTNYQIETAAQIGAVLAMALDLYGEYGERIKDHFFTHYEFAMIDGYGPWQGDPDVRYDGCNWTEDEEFGNGGNIMRGKIIYYVNLYKEKGIPEEYLGD